MKKIDSTPASSPVNPTKRSGKKPNKVKTSNEASIPKKPVNSLDRYELKTTIQKKLEELEKAGVNEEDYQKAFIQLALQWEFGELLEKDPEAQQLINNINETIKTDKNAQKKFAQLLETLKK